MPLRFQSWRSWNSPFSTIPGTDFANLRDSRLVFERGEPVHTPLKYDRSTKVVVVHPRGISIGVRGDRVPRGTKGSACTALIPSQNSRTKPLPPSNVSSGSPDLSTSRRVAIALCPKADSFSSRSDVSIQITWRGTRNGPWHLHVEIGAGGGTGEDWCYHQPPWTGSVLPPPVSSSSHHRSAIFLSSFAEDLLLCGIANKTPTLIKETL